jgi:hypothetical protein
MKVFTVLCVFSHNDVLGASVLTLGNVLPTMEITDESVDSLNLAREMCHNYMGIDKAWPLDYEQIGVFETGGIEKNLYVVYSLYFPDINATRAGAFWKKINDLEELDTIHTNIIRYTAIKRY